MSIEPSCAFGRYDAFVEELLIGPYIAGHDHIAAAEQTYNAYNTTKILKSLCGRVSAWPLRFLNITKREIIDLYPS